MVMNGDEPPQVTTQDMTCILGEPSIEPAPIPQTAGGPNNLISGPDLEDPIM